MDNHEGCPPQLGKGIHHENKARSLLPPLQDPQHHPCVQPQRTRRTKEPRYCTDEEGRTDLRFMASIWHQRETEGERQRSREGERERGSDRGRQRLRETRRERIGK